MEEMIVARQCVRQRAGVLIVTWKTDMSTATRGDMALSLDSTGENQHMQVRDCI